MTSRLHLPFEKLMAYQVRPLLKVILLSLSIISSQNGMAQIPATVIFPPLSRIGIIPAPCAWVNDAPDCFGRLHCGEFGWGEIIELQIENPIVWARVQSGETQAASVYPYDGSAPVTTLNNGGNTFYTSELPQGAEGEGWIFQVVSEIDGLVVKLTATIQTLTTAKCSKDELKKSLLSVVVRPPLSMAQFQHETPILPGDMAGFEFFTTDSIGIYFRDPAWPTESSSILTDHRRSLHFHCSEIDAGQKPDFSKFKVGNNGIEDVIGNFKDNAFRVHSHQQFKEKDHLWFIFEASGETFRNTKEFLGYYICYQDGQPTLHITAEVPEEERESLALRLKTFRESLTFVRFKRSRDK